MEEEEVALFNASFGGYYYTRKKGGEQLKERGEEGRGKTNIARRKAKKEEGEKFFCGLPAFWTERKKEERGISLKGAEGKGRDFDGPLFLLLPLKSFSSLPSSAYPWHARFSTFHSENRT